MKLIFTTFGLFCSLAAAAQFTPNNLAVLRVGDGSTALGTTTAQVSIVEFTKAGAQVGTAISIPSTTINNRLVLPGNPGTAINIEGALRLSSNKAFLTFAGYDAATGFTPLTSTTKVIARIGADAVPDISTKITETTGVGIRSVVSTDGTKFWFNYSTSAGVRYVEYPGSTGPISVTDSRDWRSVNIINDQLYGNVSNGLTQIGAVSAATSSTTPLTSVQLFSHNSSPSPSFSGYGFILFDLDATELGYDVAYHLSQGNNTTRGLVKSIKSSGVWTTGGGFTIAATGVTGNSQNVTGYSPAPATNPSALVDITGTLEGGKPALYITRGHGENNSLIKLVDNNGYANAINGLTFTHLASAGTGYTFKGVAFTPNSDVQTLPLKLKSFKASLSNNAGNLSWITTDEVNTKQFTVERGLNANDFKAIAVISTRNESGEQYYSYQDKDIQNGVNYYRLKISDQDGTYFYSDIKFLDNKLNKEFTISVYPNPVTDDLFINHEVLKANSFLDIINSTGTIVKTVNLSTGSTQTTVDATQLITGSYIIKLNNGGSISMVKFLKN